MYTKILIDVSNLFHRCHHVSKTMTTVLEDGTSLTTGGIYTSIRSVKKIERDFLSPNGEMFFLCDATHLRLVEGDAPLRKQIDPDYKATRVANSDPSFYRGLDFFVLAMHHFRDKSFVIRVPGYEADDLVAPTIENFVRPEDQVLLVSCDLDWARYIAPNITLLRSTQNEFLTEETFSEKFGFMPSYNAIRMYKTFRGDGSDNIPIGLPQIREDLLLRILRQFSSIDDLFHQLGSLEFISDSWKAKILVNKGRLKLNWELVGALPIDPIVFQSSIYSCLFSPKSLSHIYKSLGFSIASLDPRLATFGEKKKIDGFFQYSTIERV